jgi:hypothetical protein
VTRAADCVLLRRAAAPICEADASARETPGYPYSVHDLPPMFVKSIVL